ncbi:MAG: hypothetical protein AB8D78_14915 [Akkermansiaceae bacterium]
MQVSPICIPVFFGFSLIGFHLFLKNPSGNVHKEVGMVEPSTSSRLPSAVDRRADFGAFTKRQRASAQVAVSTADSGIKDFFGKAEVGSKVRLFQNVRGVTPLEGEILMLHSLEDGSQTARVIGQSTLPSGQLAKRSLFLASSKAGYEGFIREIGSTYAWKFSSSQRTSDELVFSQIPLDQLICASISGGKVSEGMPADSNFDPPEVRATIDPRDLRGFDLEERSDLVMRGPSYALADEGSSERNPSSGYFIPKLSSKSWAKRVLYLDFDGHSLKGTVWNEDQSVIKVKSIVGEQVDADFIRRVWLKVSAAYAPFRVNVTTDSRVFAKAKPRERLRVLGSSNPRQIGESNIGGISYVGTFGQSFYQPSFFFVKSFTTSTNAGRVAIHESGHSMGLFHDGRSSSPSQEYYRSHGKSPRKWASWMGHSSGADITQWSRGQYYLASNKEDDLSMLQSVLGSTSEGPSSLRKPITLSLPGKRNGQIISRDDFDFYVIKGGKGKNVKIRVSPRMGSRSLIPSLLLLDASGSRIPSRKFRWENGLTVVRSVTLPSNYVVAKVGGAGFGNPWKPKANGFPTGATDYGSIGPYRISVTLD